jgi:hypothetical protein
MFNRVYTELVLRQFILNSIAFGVSNGTGFAVLGRARITSSSIHGIRRVLYLHLYKVELDKIEPFWLYLSSHKLPFLNRDAAHIWHALNCVQIFPLAARVHLCGISGSRVYDVMLPQFVTFLSDRGNHNRSRVLALESDPDILKLEFVIKVVIEDDPFKREVEVLERLDPSYYLGFLSFSGEIGERTERLPIVEIRPDVQQKIYDQFNNSDESAWWRQGLPLPTTGGVIFMQVGKSLKGDIDLQMCDVFGACMEQLHDAHEKSILHRDCRQKNILVFNGKPTLIDWDHALQKGMVCTVNDEENGRKPFLPMHLRKRLREEKSFDYEWTVRDDVEMLSHSLLHGK